LSIINKISKVAKTPIQRIGLILVSISGGYLLLSALIWNIDALSYSGAAKHQLKKYPFAYKVTEYWVSKSTKPTVPNTSIVKGTPIVLSGNLERVGSFNHYTRVYGYVGSWIEYDRECYQNNKFKIDTRITPFGVTSPIDQGGCEIARYKYDVNESTFYTNEGFKKYLRYKHLGIRDGIYWIFYLTIISAMMLLGVVDYLVREAKALMNWVLKG